MNTLRENFVPLHLFIIVNSKIRYLCVLMHLNGVTFYREGDKITFRIFDVELFFISCVFAPMLQNCQSLGVAFKILHRFLILSFPGNEKFNFSSRRF